MSDAAQLANAWLQHGIALFEQGALEDAAGSFSQAIALLPDFADAHNNLGTVRLEQGRPAEAAVCYQQLLQLNPEHVDAHFNLGVALAQQGRLDEAAASYERALQINGQRYDAWNNLGNVHKERRHWSAAIACYQQALRWQPSYVQAHNNLGQALAELGRVEEAIGSYQRAISLSPNYAKAHSNLGSILAQQGRLDEAASCYREALRLTPHFAEAHYNLGKVLGDQGRLEQAVACYAEAIRLQPDFAQAHYNLGKTLEDLGRLSDAVPVYQEAVRLSPKNVESKNNLATVLVRHGQLDDALAHYEEAIRVTPGYGEAHFNRALVWLLRGDFEKGWPEYEWRWKVPGFKRRQFTVPLWDGKPLDGRTILLHAEQGLGDTIQFLRFASLVKQRGGTVLVDCQPALLPLAATCSGIDRLLRPGEPQPAFDVHAPVLSLGGILGTRLATIPADIPYLAADPVRVERWRKELAAVPPFKVGVVWQGSVGFKGDRYRSVPLMQFAPLADIPGVSLFSLQVGYGSEQLATAGLPVTDLTGRFEQTSLADLAAVLTCLDLLITVDTAPAHLAGALGVPVWVALPKSSDWRWLLERDDSPWYPTMRLFRQQQAGDWSTVFRQMARALEERTRAAACP
jgi:tetratricopeptide (TPR) repeat protein